MDSIKSRERTSLRLWVLLVAIGVAIVAACGFAKPAWADHYSTLSGLANAFGEDQLTIVSGTGSGNSGTLMVTGDNAKATANVVLDSGNYEINLNGKTIDMDNYAIGINSGGVLTINDVGGGMIKGNPNELPIIQAQGGTLIINSGRIVRSEDPTVVCGAVQVGSAILDDQKNVTGYNNGVLIMNGGVVENSAGIGIRVLSGSGLLNGGTVTGGQNVTGGQSANQGYFAAIIVQNKSELTVNGATVNAVNSELPGKPEGSNNGGGITIYDYATLNIQNGNISGLYAVITGGSDKQGTGTFGAKINVSGGTLTGANDGTAMYLPTPYKGENKVTITGGTIKGGAGIINLGSNLTVSGGTIESTATTETVQAGDAKGVAGAAFEYPAVGIVAAADGNSEGGYGDNTTTTVDGGVVKGGIVSGVAVGQEPNTANVKPALTIGGNALVEGDVVNESAGKTTIDGGTITGTVANTGTGTTEYVAGTVEGGFEGNITEPAPNPGDPQAIQTAVSGVVTPVTEAMAPYADVTVSADAYTWTVETTNGETPIATVANDLVAPIISALNAAGSPSATSIQNPAVTITLAGSTLASQQSFALDVLENAVAIAPATLGPDATLSDLQGMTASISAETTSNALTYTFIFAGESPEPPANEVAIYRLYNPYEEYHLYTKNTEEYEFLSTHGWNDEGIYWYAPAEAYEGTYTIIRLYNPYNGDHYYVMETDTEQIDFLTDAGWVPDNEEASFLSAPVDGPYPVYTLFNPFSQVNTHVYTPREAEVANLEAAGMQINTTIIWAEALPPAAE